MAEYIERAAALHEIERREALMVGDKCVSVAAMKSFIKNRPAADVAPVVHGRWKASGGLLECQNCGEIYSTLGGNEGKAWDYCPDCGARMDGGSDAKAD